MGISAECQMVSGCWSSCQVAIVGLVFIGRRQQRLAGNLFDLCVSSLPRVEACARFFDRGPVAPKPMHQLVHRLQQPDP